MTDASRKYILARRANGGTDLSKLSLSTGNLSVDDALKIGIYTINSTQQIGIATATEAGLSPDRYPIRIKIAAALPAPPEPKAETCVSIWKVVTLDMRPVLFSRRPIVDTTAVENLYANIPELDGLMWDAVTDAKVKDRKSAVHDTVTAISDVIYPSLLLAEHTPATLTTLRENISKLITESASKACYPYIKVTPEYFILFRPHGYVPAAHGSVSADMVPTLEVYLNTYVNFTNMRKRYTAEQVPDGALVMAAGAAAAMFRYGLFEVYESQEYYTLYVQPMTNETKKFTVVQAFGPRGLPGPSDYPVSSVIDINKITISDQMLEIGPILCVSAGLNHYMFNHTTGGSIASGSLLTVLSMYKVIDQTSQRAYAEMVTSVFYEALHPVNKRGIANLFFKNSRVTTHGRASDAMRYTKFNLDQFTQIRLKPQPAGAHKAFICAQGLDRIISAGLAMFLEWQGQINDVIGMCGDVLRAGAEAHLGAHYYTGKAGSSQTSSLDSYLPEIACYMNSLARNDTLTMSPHLSQETAARASMHWQNLMKALKGEDFSSANPELVKKYLQTQGKVFSSFDISKEETWAEAAEFGKRAREALRKVMY